MAPYKTPERRANRKAMAIAGAAIHFQPPTTAPARDAEVSRIFRSNVRSTAISAGVFSRK
jgi:hypothetical protein